MRGETISHYRIAEKLGGGGMGVVYRAEDLRLGRTVAMKFLPEGLCQDHHALERFKREARAASALVHPNICTVYDIGDHGSQPFIVMEFVDGKTLKEVLVNGPVPADRLLEIGIQIADALSATHAKGIIHRDIKPANVMLASDGRTLILDFGLAKLKPVMPGGKEDEFPTEDLSMGGLILGTLPYMSPEQVKGKVVDHRTDIFSLGVVLHEMATGTRPFQGETPADLISSILRDAPELTFRPGKGCPPGLLGLIEYCLQKDPTDRPESMVEVRKSLEEIRDGQSVDLPLSRPSVAVLPFADLSRAGDQEYLADGIVEELTGSLARIHGLRVASRTSSFMYRESQLDIREIGRRLEVETVLEGSIRKDGDRLRLTVQLIKVADGYHLWAQNYDQRIQDIFSIQQEIAQNIAGALRIALTPVEQSSIRLAATSSLEAYDYYMRGHKFFYQFTGRGVELALKMYSLAINHDPGFALAYAGMANCHAFLFLFKDRSAERLEAADSASRKALELNSQLSEVHVARGQVLSLSLNHEEAEIEFETAIALGPTNFEAYYLYARDTFAQGKLEKAAYLFEMASKVSPEDYQSPLLIAQIYCDLGRLSDAEAARQRGVGLVEERLKQYPDDVRAVYMAANGLAALGERERALEWANLALSMEPFEPMVLYNVACIFSLAGELEQALSNLERAVDLGLSQKEWLENDNNLDPLRNLPRFEALMKRL